MPFWSPFTWTVASGLLIVVPGSSVAADAAVQTARPEPGYLGVLAVDAAGSEGALLAEVVPDSPAAKAGLRSGDVVVAANGQPVQGAADFIATLSDYGPGSSLTLRVQQAGFSRDLETTLGTRPEPARRRFPEFGRVGASLGSPYWPTVRPDTLLDDQTPSERRLGIHTQPANRAALARRRLPDRPGVLVARIERDSAADLAGIPLGSLIVAVDSVAVSSPQALTRAFNEASESIELTYLIGDEERTCRILRPK